MASSYPPTEASASTSSRTEDGSSTWTSTDPTLDPDRQRVVQLLIARYMAKKKADADDAWIAAVPERAKRIEMKLFKAAKTREEYTNEATFDTRLRAAVAAPAPATLASKPAAKPSRPVEEVIKEQAKMLILLRHAAHCKSATGKCTVSPECASRYRGLWLHLVQCRLKACGVGKCEYARFLVAHFQQCRDEGCDVCQIVRPAIERYQQQQQALAGAGGRKEPAFPIFMPMPPPAPHLVIPKRPLGPPIAVKSEGESKALTSTTASTSAAEAPASASAGNETKSSFSGLNEALIKKRVEELMGLLKTLPGRLRALTESKQVVETALARVNECQFRIQNLSSSREESEEFSPDRASALAELESELSYARFDHESAKAKCEELERQSEAVDQERLKLRALVEEACGGSVELADAHISKAVAQHNEQVAAAERTRLVEATQQSIQAEELSHQRQTQEASRIQQEQRLDYAQRQRMEEEEKRFAALQKLNAKKLPLHVLRVKPPAYPFQTQADVQRERKARERPPVVTKELLERSLILRTAKIGPIIEHVRACACEPPGKRSFRTEALRIHALLLSASTSAHIFRRPVEFNEVRMQEYLSVVKRPMDLGTIRSRLDQSKGVSMAVSPNIPNHPYSGNVLLPPYKTMQEFANDVRLTFTNAILYNTLDSPVGKLAFQLGALFEQEYATYLEETARQSTPASLPTGPVICDFCFKGDVEFEVPEYSCSGTVCDGALIRRNAFMYVWTPAANAQGEKVYWCEKCYDNPSCGGTTYMRSSDDDRKYPRRDMTKIKNDESHREEWIYCNYCHRKAHTICALLADRSNLEPSTGVLRDPYHCPYCVLRAFEAENDARVAQSERRRVKQLAKLGLEPPEPCALPAAIPEELAVVPETYASSGDEIRFPGLKDESAKALPENAFSQHVERAVRERILTERRRHAAQHQIPLMAAPDAEIIVRIVEAKDYELPTRRGMLGLYGDPPYNYPKSFPLRQKVLCAFQHLDGVDVLFYICFLQFYSSEAPAPNTRSVYIAYLDSVNYLRPSFLRTPIYQEILISVIAYAKSLGFTRCFIWACPPTGGNDYVFNCHPTDQKVPDTVILRNWYLRLLEDARRRGVVVSLTTLYDEYFTRIPDVTHVPYFEGDWWQAYGERHIANLLKTAANPRALQARADAARIAARNLHLQNMADRRLGNSLLGGGASKPTALKAATESAQQQPRKRRAAALAALEKSFQESALYQARHDSSDEDEQHGDVGFSATLRRVGIVNNANAPPDALPPCPAPRVLEQVPLQDVLTAKIREENLRMRRDFIVVKLCFDCAECSRALDQPGEAYWLPTAWRPYHEWHDYTQAQYAPPYCLCHSCYLEAYRQEFKEYPTFVMPLTKEEEEEAKAKQKEAAVAPSEGAPPSTSELAAEPTLAPSGASTAAPSPSALSAAEEEDVVKPDLSELNENDLPSSYMTPRKPPNGSSGDGPPPQGTPTSEVAPSPDSALPSHTSAAMEVEYDEEEEEADVQKLIESTSLDELLSKNAEHHQLQHQQASEEATSEPPSNGATPAPTKPVAASGRMTRRKRKNVHANQIVEDLVELHGDSARSSAQGSAEIEVLAPGLRARPPNPYPVRPCSLKAMHLQRADIASVIRDPDGLRECAEFDGRQDFLDVCRAQNYQFEELRRAKYSTAHILQRLHAREDATSLSEEDPNMGCSVCATKLAGLDRHTCRVCASYNLCGVCAETTKHEHPLWLVNASSSRDAASIQTYVNLMIHARSCVDSSTCETADCVGMKRLLNHIVTCELRDARCQYCKRFNNIVVIHARQCRLVEHCPVFTCDVVKKQIRLARDLAESRNDRRILAFNPNFVASG